VVTDDQALADAMRMIAAHGSNVRYYHETLGVNSRLDTLQAAILGVKLKHLDQWNTARQRAATRYTELLAGAPVTTPYVEPYNHHIFHQYTIRTPRRDVLSAFLKEMSIPHAIYYPVPLHLQKAFVAYGYTRGDFPVTESAAAEVLSLPMHTELDEEQLVHIAAAVKQFFVS